MIRRSNLIACSVGAGLVSAAFLFAVAVAGTPVRQTSTGFYKISSTDSRIFPETAGQDVLLAAMVHDIRMLMECDADAFVLDTWTHGSFWLLSQDQSNGDVASCYFERALGEIPYLLKHGKL